MTGAVDVAQSLLGSMAKLDLKTVDYPAMILIRVPGAPEDSPAGAAPPIMIVSSDLRSYLSLSLSLSLSRGRSARVSFPPDCVL